MQTAIPYMQLRSGSSKGLYFKRSDLPEDVAARDAVLIAAMEGVTDGDERQIDGLGGGHPLTSKVGIVALSDQPGIDLEYLFAQVVVGQGRVDTTQNCGNILAGVGAFALESGMITSTKDVTRINVLMNNSNKGCELVLQTPNGEVTYAGDVAIDGVPGTAAPVICNYKDVTGAICGSLFPTGAMRDEVDGVDVTCIDNGMPVVLLRASDFDVSGDESPEELNANDALKEKLESIRLQLGPKMNLGDVSDKVVPKMTLISPPKNNGLINTRTFIPHACHTAVGVLGAVTVATACMITGTIADGLSNTDAGEDALSVEHPSGEFSVTLDIDRETSPPTVKKAGLLRTTRLLSRGEVFIPAGAKS
jgi:4-oxalomesaconate tautomerase